MSSRACARSVLFVAALALAQSVPAQGEHSHGHGGHHPHEDTLSGRAAEPSRATRTVSVDMTDNMRFTPAEIRVKRGEIVRFLARNKGQVMHEMVVGTMQELKQHAERMREHQPMAHDESHGAHVAPGKAAQFAWQFTRTGEFYYACLVPGHFEAGMVGKLIVTP